MPEENDSYQCTTCGQVWASNDFDGCVNCGGELKKLVPVGKINGTDEIIWGTEE